MKLILLQDIRGIGKKFDIKEIKDGYARNFLIPRNLAKIATDSAINDLKSKKLILEKREKDLKIKLESLAKNLAEREFVFSLNVGKKEEVFGSITKDDIKNRIDENIDVEIKLEKPIKAIGEHQVEINLGKGIKTIIQIKVEPLSS